MKSNAASNEPISMYYWWDAMRLSKDKENKMLGDVYTARLSCRWHFFRLHVAKCGHRIKKLLYDKKNCNKWTFVISDFIIFLDFDKKNMSKIDLYQTCTLYIFFPFNLSNNTMKYEKICRKNTKKLKKKYFLLISLKKKFL